MRHLPLRRVAFTGVLLLAATTMSFASEEAGHGAEGHDSAAWMTLGFAFFNFFLFVFLLRKFAWPPVKDYLFSRRSEVEAAMAAAKNAREEAEAIRREFAIKEAALDETRRRMLEELRIGAEADRERALRDANAAAQRMKAEAEQQAQNELARARRELRAEAARLAAELAEQDIRAKLTDADRTRLVREFVEGVARP